MWGVWAGLFMGATTGLTQSITVRGFVVSPSGEPVVGANIQLLPGSGKDITRAEGFFSITSPTTSAQLGRHLYIFHVGYQPDTIALTFPLDSIIIIRLAERQLETVEMIAPAVDAVSLSEMGVLRLPLALVRKLPTLLGETDVIKALALMPGVQTSHQGNSTLLVRGGSQDQNLVLIDGVPAYNLTHLFGFVSIVNPDVVKGVTLYKGNFPARFGGRLSSVLEIDVRHGAQDSLQAELSLGALASRLRVEGPLFGGKGGFIAAGRASYLGLALLPLGVAVRRGTADSQLNYWLADGNFKAFFRWGEKQRHRIAFNVYGGTDRWRAQEGRRSQLNTFGLNWGNQIVSLTYAHTLGQRGFGEAILYTSRYAYALNVEQMSRPAVGDTLMIFEQGFQNRTDVWDAGLRYSIKYDLSAKYKLEVGGSVIRHQFRPSRFRLWQETFTQVTGAPMLTSLEAGLYGEAQWEALPSLSLTIGGRLSLYTILGKTYLNGEPRLSLGWELGSGWVAKAGYARMIQYLHLLSNSGVGLPNDVWVPVTERIPPAQAHQVGLAVEKSWTESGFSLSIEGFHKVLSGLAGYPRGTNLLANIPQNWEDILLTGGDGQVWGAELMLGKTAKRWSGWLAYTLMRSQRRFETEPDPHWFPDRHDRRHMFNLVLSLSMTTRWSLTTTFQYLSGTPVTAPIAVYRDLNGSNAWAYGPRGNVRIPPHHQLDLGLERKRTNPNGKLRTLSFGVYNLYNRQNPFYIEVSQSGDPGQQGQGFSLVQHSLFPLLPYLAYRWAL